MQFLGRLLENPTFFNSLQMPWISGQKALQVLQKLGFQQVRQRGSHVVLRKETADGPVGCSLPMHKELAVGTLAGILKQAKVFQEEFPAKL